jgi:hypothetical protein
VQRREHLRVSSGVLLGGGTVCTGGQGIFASYAEDDTTWVGFCALWVNGLPIPQVPNQIRVQCADLGN